MLNFNYIKHFIKIIIYLHTIIYLKKFMKNPYIINIENLGLLHLNVLKKKDFKF